MSSSEHPKQSTLAQLQHALSLDPHNPALLHAIGSHYRASEPRHALGYYQRAYALDETSLHICDALAELHLELQEDAEAIGLLHNALKKGLKTAKTHYLLGVAYEKTGRKTEAADQYLQALDVQPNLEVAHARLAQLLLSMERLQEAFVHASVCTRLAPSSPTHHTRLASVLQALQHWEEASAHYQQALALDPTLRNVRQKLGDIALLLNQGMQAAQLYRAEQAAWPASRGLHRRIGVAYQSVDQREAAIHHYQRALAEDPRDAAVHNNLGLLFRAQHRYPQAKAHLEKAIQIDENNAQALLHMGNILQEHPPIQTEKAVQCYRKAIAQQPGFSEAHNNLASTLLTQGKREEALQSYRTAIQHNPRFFAAYRQLAIQTKHKTYSPIIQRMETLFHEPSLGALDRMQLAFGLGKAFDDLSQHERAFSYFHTANQLQRRQFQYEHRKVERHFETIAQSFDPSFFRALPARTPPASTPIFIVGMMRSGTTLTEQILSSHPAVHGAGEVHILPRLIASFGEKASPRTLASLTATEYSNLGERYWKALQPYNPRKSILTDKLPSNFMRIGLIHAMLPHAKIIHCERSSMDTCWSIYRHFFTDPYPYASNLEELGAFYTLYQQLMRHWTTSLPGFVYTLRYGSLIHSPEEEIRKLLRFCGLPWSESCLHPHRSNRVVRTPSLFQVREPIHQRSVNRWQPYRRWLAPLLAALGIAEA